MKASVEPPTVSLYSEASRLTDCIFETWLQCAVALAVLLAASARAMEPLWHNFCLRQQNAPPGPVLPIVSFQAKHKVGEVRSGESPEPRGELQWQGRGCLSPLPTFCGVFAFVTDLGH